MTSRDTPFANTLANEGLDRCQHPENVWLWQKRPEPEESALVMEAAGNGVIEGLMTPTLFLYAMLVLDSGIKDKEEVKLRGEKLPQCITIIPQQKRVFMDGFAGGLWNDIEDCWQYHAAKRYKDPVNVIVTNRGRQVERERHGRGESVHSYPIREALPEVTRRQ